MTYFMLIFDVDAALIYVISLYIPFGLLVMMMLLGYVRVVIMGMSLTIFWGWACMTSFCPYIYEIFASYFNTTPSPPFCFYQDCILTLDLLPLRLTPTP